MPLSEGPTPPVRWPLLTRVGMGVAGLALLLGAAPGPEPWAAAPGVLLLVAAEQTRWRGPALASGLVALIGVGWSALQWSTWWENQLPPGEIFVTVAARELPMGTRITEADIYAVTMPTGFVPPSAFVVPDDLIGRRVSERILADEVIRAERIAETRAAPPTPVPVGDRAVDVPDPGAVAIEGGHIDAVWDPGRPCTVARYARVVATGEGRAWLAAPPRVAGALDHVSRDPTFRLRRPEDTGTPEAPCSW